MLGAVPKSAVQELLIHTPDGKTRVFSLDRDRITLGRAAGNDLCYPEDAGLSRQHLAIEHRNTDWVITDLKSKNGTVVNSTRITEPQRLKPGDRIAAGHLVLEFASKQPEPLPDKTVVFFENPNVPTSSSTMRTSLAGLLSEEKELEGGGKHMRALVRAYKALVEHMSIDKLFHLIVDLSIETVGAARGVLLTYENGELEVRAAKGEGFRISKTVRDTVLKDRTSLLVRDARLDQAFAERLSIVAQQVRSFMAVPLQTDKGVIGLIYLDSPHFVHEFTKDDLDLLTIMAYVAAIRVEHARLAEIEEVEHMHTKELEQAAEIQRGLLPKKSPCIPGIDLAGYNSPCRTVGGDYFDFLPCDDGRVTILVADVAGKGMPAAMLMSNLQARAQVLFEDPSDLAELMKRLNRIIAKTCPLNRFISMFVGVYNTKTCDMTYCNAGHNPPLVLRCNGPVQELGSTGVVLGILPNESFEQSVVHLAPGDTVVLFSDGITEACRPDSDEQFGEERLARILREGDCTSAETMLDRVQRALTEWIGNAAPGDDITLVIARRTE